VTEILVALAAAAGVLAVGLLLLTGRQVLARTRSGGHTASRSSIDTGDAEWIYGDRLLSDRPARRLSSQAREQSGVIAQSDVPPPTIDVEDKAAAILGDAERRAAEIMARARTERESLLEQKLELAREQELVAEKHARLSTLLDTALAELERASANGSSNVGELKAVRDELRATE
jgi:hypothetical protein